MGPGNLSSVTPPKRSPLGVCRADPADRAAHATPCAERSGSTPERAVVLPGSGSDEHFVRSVFHGPLRAFGITLVAPAPRPGGDVVDGYLAALDAALEAAPGPLLVGGISLGAQVAAAWAARRWPEVGDRLAGLLLALPAWTGQSGAAPAACAALATAAQVRSGGVEAALAVARAGAPPWLAAELGRAWPRYGSGLAPALEAAAATPGPEPGALRALGVPAGIAALHGDAVHPLAEARRWRDLMPRAALVTSTLPAFGADPEVVGRAAVLGWLRASVPG
jgi:pimeloyl-ACP methyl ester carboxylesterase